MTAAAGRLAALAGLLLVGVACGTETGNPEDLVLSYEATSSDPAGVAIRAPAAQAEVDAVWLRLADVTLRSDCDGGGPTAVLEGLGFADHADPAPVVQRAEVALDTVCAVDTALVPGPAAPGEAAAVAGSSLALQGALADGRAFTVVLGAEVPLTLRLPDLPVPSAGGWLLAFDVAPWIDALDLAALPGDPVQVDTATEPALLADLQDAIPAGVSLLEDLDGDGVIDPEDRPLAP